jgi:hypothetical protein
LGLSNISKYIVFSPITDMLKLFAQKLKYQNTGIMQVDSTSIVGNHVRPGIPHAMLVRVDNIAT